MHLSGDWSGSPSCFIFSSTLGIKFSYHGRHGPELLADNDQIGTAGFYADLDQFLIGNGDIAIDRNLATGSSNLENCYGIGLDRGSQEAKIMMAGSPHFDIDAVEFWLVD